MHKSGILFSLAWLFVLNIVTCAFWTVFHLLSTLILVLAPETGDRVPYVAGLKPRIHDGILMP